MLDLVPTLKDLGENRTVKQLEIILQSKPQTANPASYQDPAGDVPEEVCQL